MGRYAEDPAWADLTPLPTDEGGPNPLAAIAYSDDYAETMSYLRAAMAANDHSARVLDLTLDLISMNPAHYTVWLYRAQTLFALGADLSQELAWLNETALQHQKNYQIWHHRNLIVDRLGEAVDVQAEREFVERMFGLDAKNYHVWSYRQWLVRRFGLFGREELGFVERMLGRDVRNNSAWNHRWFVVNGEEGAEGVRNQDVRVREVAFAKKAVEKAPQNQSPWSYLRAVLKKSGVPFKSLKEFAEVYANLDEPEGVRSTHALDLLADILAEEEGEKERAGIALDLLSTKYDPIRKNYWEYRRGLLGLPPSAAA